MRLQLNARYPRQINKFLSEQSVTVLLVRDRAMGELSLAQFFAPIVTSLATTFGRNDWRPALMTALAHNDAFSAEPAQYFGERKLPADPAFVADQ